MRIFGSIYTGYTNWVVRNRNKHKPYGIILLTVLLVCSFFSHKLWALSWESLALNPFVAIGYIFTHLSPDHIAGNLLFLGLLGPVCERKLGLINTLTLFLVAGVVSGVTYLIAFPNTSLIGASGAVAALFAVLPAAQHDWVSRGYLTLISLLYLGLNVYAFYLEMFSIFPTPVAYLGHIIGYLVGVTYMCFFLWPKKSR